MDQGTVTPEDNTVTDEPQQEAEVRQEAPEHTEEETKVPLHVVQKERRKRQEAEERLRQLEAQIPQEEDDSIYESATKADLNVWKAETKREISESEWVSKNPKLYEKVNEELAQFLTTKPHYKKAIADSPNRYKEAYELMNAFKAKSEHTPTKTNAPSQAPQSPASVPKIAAMNETVDVMKMSDAEYDEWISSKSTRRRVH